MQVPFARPRVRTDVLEHAEYYELRGRMIQFLEDQDHRKHASKQSATPEVAVALPASA
jgi:nitrate/nitrite transport system ATP-binding protein